MARKRATLTDLLNDLTYKTLYDKFKLIAIDVFKWEGLPEGIDEKYIERLLFKYGKAIFFKDPNQSYMCLQAQQGENLNVYGEPLYWRAIGLNYNKRYKAEECVIIGNNKLRLNTKDVVMFYVNKIAEAERTMDVNIKACKTPIIFAVDDKDVLTFKRLFQQVDGNVPAIFADKNLNIDSIQAFDTKASFMGNELMDYKTSVENELLTFLGINNLPTDKKERLITDEANSNNQLIKSFVELQKESRKQACEEINTLFGLNVSVDLRIKNVEGVDNNVDNSDEGHRQPNSGTQGNN